MRRLIKHEPTTTIVVWFSINSALIGLHLALRLDMAEWRRARPARALGFVRRRQLLLTQSYRYADASTIAPFDYTQMIWVLIVAWFLFGEHLLALC